jgi:PIN domain nuclease of toxin-antitoxin system
MSSASLLLDTHCWIWMALGDKARFRPLAIRRIEEAARSGSLLVSVISVWEIAMLESKGRIRFQKPCLEWVREALETPGLSLAGLTPEIAVDSSRLPGNFHGDPADRILAATARNLGVPLMTRDPKLIEYGRRRLVSVVPA